MKSTSIVIPAGRPERLKDIFVSLLKQDIGSDLIEIIVVTPRQQKELPSSDKRIKYILTDELFSPGKMRNIGAFQALGEYIAFIDDDCIPDVNWLSCAAHTLEEHAQNGCIGCRVVFPEKKFWTSAADYSLFACYQYSTKREICLGSAAILTTKEIIREISGFDEHLLASEDWDLCLKIQAIGRLCIFEPSAEVKHRHGCESLSTILEKSYRWGYDSGLIVQKRHRGQMSWLAKLSIALASPAFYWVLIVPYSLFVTGLQSIEFIRFNPRYLSYLPIVLLSKIAYHFGVWRRLMIS